MRDRAGWWANIGFAVCGESVSTCFTIYPSVVSSRGWLTPFWGEGTAYLYTHTHTCSETAYRIIDVECIVRAKTLQLNLTDTVKTDPFRGETERITKMMWPPALQQHPGASLRFLFSGETDRITKWCDHQLCNSIQVRQYGSFFLARRTESPNDVTTSYATASRCVTTVPFYGETDRITKWCDHQLCNSIQVHHYGSISWRDG